MRIRTLVIFILCLCALSGCAAAPETPAPTETPTAPVETPEVPQETPVPTPTPAEPESEPEDAPIIDDTARLDTDPLTIPANTLFIGDSITHHLCSRYLTPLGYADGVSFMASSNAGIPHYFADWARLKNADWNSHGCSYDQEFYNLSYAKAIELSAGRWERIFFMMGSNGSGTLTYESYKEVIDHIYANNPTADIYLQTVPDCHTGTVTTDAVNAIVAQTVDVYAAEGIATVHLLDTNSIWTAECILRDGVHLADIGLQLWHEYICEITQ